MGLCKVFVLGRGLWGRAWLGDPHAGAIPLVLGDPHAGAIPLVLALPASREPPLCWHWCSWTPAWMRAEVRHLLSGAEHGVPLLTPVSSALLPYVPRVPPAALLGKLTATTFALERPCCVFDRHANASDTVWLVVAFANGEHPLLRHVLPATAGGRGGPSPQPLTPRLCHTASAAFGNPLSRDDVPPYERLPTTHSYMTLEMAAAAYACSSPSPAVLRVGGDTACGSQGGQDPCNGPLPSPGPYR